jgi:hypothetical protein
MYLIAVHSLEVPLKIIQWTVSIECSATPDFSVAGVRNIVHVAQTVLYALLLLFLSHCIMFYYLCNILSGITPITDSNCCDILCTVTIIAQL